jgi:acyl-CoA synthetase (AMP-forming)/AMP-acid ligase II
MAARWDSIPAMVRWAAQEHGETEALVGADRLSFSQLSSRVDRAAASLIGVGFAPGDVAAIWAPNIEQWPVAALAVLACGGRLVPINTRYKGAECIDLLERSGAKVIFTVTGFLETDYATMLIEAAGGSAAGRPANDLVELEHIIVLSGVAPVGCMTDADFVGAGAAVAAHEVDARVAAIRPDDVSDIIFTSGTTGRSKGVVSTHGQSLEVFDTWSRLIGLRKGDRYLIVNPFFHTFGYKAGILASLMCGTTMIPHAVFDAETVLARISEEKVTMLPGPPALYQGLLSHPGLAAADISSLRLGVTGAASIPVSLIEQMATTLGFETVLTAYGLTEATGVVSMCREGDDAATIAATSGCAIDGVELQIVDVETGKVLPAGEAGEITVRGFNVMQGYLDDPEQTDAAIDAEGWLHTGDIGVLNERGYLDITDRLKDMFIVGGFNAYPAEIENVLIEHPDIAQVAVVGMPHERLGEVGVAFAVAASGNGLDQDAVIAWARERMANFKVPRRLVTLPALPANASGKILKSELRARLADEHAGTTP